MKLVCVFTILWGIALIPTWTLIFQLSGIPSPEHTWAFSGKGYVQANFQIFGKCLSTCARYVKSVQIFHGLGQFQEQVLPKVGPNVLFQRSYWIDAGAAFMSHECDSCWIVGGTMAIILHMIIFASNLVPIWFQGYVFLCSETNVISRWIEKFSSISGNQTPVTSRGCFGISHRYPRAGSYLSWYCGYLILIFFSHLTRKVIHEISFFPKDILG